MNAGKAGIQIHWTDSTNTTVASYNVYRGTAIQPTITGQAVTCPAASAFAKLGSVASVTTVTAYSFFDGTATVPATATPTDPSYCYKVTAVDVTGGESAAASVGPLVAVAATTAGTLKFLATSGVSGTGTTLWLVYPAAINTASIQTGDYTVVYTPYASGTSYTLTVATAAINSGDNKIVEITVALPVASATGDTYLVTAKNGSDGDTVTSGAGTTLLTQPVGDQVLITK